MGAFFDRMSVVLSLCTIARASRAADLDPRQAKLRDRATPRAGRAPKERFPLCHRAVFWLAGLMLLGAGTLHAKTVRLVYTDAQGTVIAKTDVQGTILGRYDYRPYGAPVSGGLPQGPGYTGHVNDADSGLVYMQQRYYNPVVGRFLSADPLNVEHGVFNITLFVYSNNNPVSEFDPTGGTSEVVQDARMRNWNGWGNQTFWRDAHCSVCLQASSGVTNLSPVKVNGSIQGGDAPPPDAAQDAPFLEPLEVMAWRASNAIPKEIPQPLRGILVHAAFAIQVRSNQALGYDAEISYLDRSVVAYGTPGSSRADATYGYTGNPLFVVDLKTGKARINSKQKRNYQKNLPVGVRVWVIQVPPP